jgi:hypothetical protein
MTAEMGEVIQIPRGQIVHAENPVAVAQQAVGKMRSEKPGCAGNKYVHGQSSVLQNQCSV